MLIIALFSSLLMLLAWYWQQRHRNAGIVDIAWALGMACAGLWFALTGSATYSVKMLLLLIAVGWFTRLALHLGARLRSETEEGRYQALRSAMRPYESMGFLLFFQFQAGLVCLFSLTFWAIAQNIHPEMPALLTAILIVLIAFAGVFSADRQLHHFRRNKKNRTLTCQIGWWRYSRHPNYFFEWLHWLAYPLLGWGGDYQLWLWLAPLMMYLFLNYLTGIPFNEQQALRKRGDNYRRYQQTTHAFFLWWPKST